MKQCVFRSKMSYYSTLIEQKSDPKKLFSNSSKLLNNQAPKQLPTSDDDEYLASAFGEFFHTKISMISSELDQRKVSISNEHFENNSQCNVKFSSFQLVKSEELDKLINGSSLKSCQLDPIPVLVLRQCYDIVIPVITKIVNLSLQHGTFHGTFKKCINNTVTEESYG